MGKGALNISHIPAFAFSPSAFYLLPSPMDLGVNPERILQAAQGYLELSLPLEAGAIPTPAEIKTLEDSCYASRRFYVLAQWLFMAAVY